MVIVVSLTTVKATAAPSIRTSVVPTKPLPEIVINVPPTTGPEDGESWLIAGTGAYR